MANWDTFYDSVSRTASKAATKAGELTDVMKLKYKLHQTKAELRETYEKIGRLTYDQLHFNHDRSAEIEKLLPKISKLHDRIRRLGAAIAKEDNAVYCAGCGTKLEQGMSYCPGCGQRQPTSAQETNTVAADTEEQA